MSFHHFSLDKAIWNPSLYRRLQKVWFGDLPVGSALPDSDATQRWFTADPEPKAAFDKLCHSEFGPALASIDPSNYPISSLSDEEAVAPLVSELEAAENGEKMRTALSLLLLLDQISRNIYRTKETLPLVYSQYDRLSRALLKHVLAHEPRLDQDPSIRFGISYRMWFYFPLMHSEDIRDHQLITRMVNDMEQDLSDKGIQDYKQFLDMWRSHEETHAKIIEKFGRYPHRNAALLRQPTREEEEYMREGGETFGVTVS
jgi:uncharacterized protein (DUF924 family)